MTPDEHTTEPDSASGISASDTGAETDAAAPAAGAPDAARGDGEATSATEPVPEPSSDLDMLVERAAQLERELGAERERATDYMQKWQRAQADHANFRRRVQQEQEQLSAVAAAQTLALVLPALDSLERAFKALPESLHQLTWIDGIALVELQLRRALEAQGLAPFEPRPGEQFDFTRHQAIAETPTAEHPEGAIVEVVQRGYELNGRALRPALVRVARKPQEAPGSTAASGSGPPETAPPPPDAAESGSSP
jgi:molecular chaperone GrpE